MIFLIQFKTPGITGHNRKLDIQASDWKLGLPNWDGGRGKRRRERKGREKEERLAYAAIQRKKIL